jgi:hypothetical protein
MEEPPAATAPSPDAAAPEGTAAAAQKPARHHRRLRVPTSVLVTLAVALLSIWVGPALTRQWDDRQKARELQADVAQQVSRTTALTISEAGAAVETGHPLVLKSRERWNVARFELEARLQAFFPAAVADWRQLSGRIDALITRGPQFHLMVSDIGRRNPSPKEVFELSQLLPAVLHPGGSSDGQRSVARKSLAVGKARAFVVPVTIAGQKILFDYTLTRLGHLNEIISDDLLASVQSLNEKVLRTTPTGFSTTRRDLLRDLLP